MNFWHCQPFQGRPTTMRIIARRPCHALGAPLPEWKVRCSVCSDLLLGRRAGHAATEWVASFLTFVAVASIVSWIIDGSNLIHYSELIKPAFLTRRCFMCFARS